MKNVKCKTKNAECKMNIAKLLFQVQRLCTLYIILLPCLTFGPIEGFNRNSKLVLLKDHFCSIIKNHFGDIYVIIPPFYQLSGCLIRESR